MNGTLGQIHQVAAEKVFELLRSRSEGLTDEEAAARRQEFGFNRLGAALAVALGEVAGQALR